MKEPDFSARKKNRDNMLLLLSHVPFQEEVKKIRSALSIEKTFVMGSEEAKKWERDLTPDKARLLRKAIRTIIDEYDLPGNYDDYISRHILHNTNFAPLNNFAVIPFSREMDPNGARHITVNIYARLTKKEERDLKDEVNRMAKNLPDFKPLKDIERKIAREELVRGAKEYNKSEDREYVARIAEVVGGGKKGGATARENLRELADHRKKRFGKK